MEYGALFCTVKRAIAPEENCPPNPKTNPKPNPNPNRGAIFWLLPNPKTNPNLDPNPNRNRGGERGGRGGNFAWEKLTGYYFRDGLVKSLAKISN